MRFLKFDVVEENISNTGETFFQKGIRAVLSKIFPIANPQFESQINSVTTWILEFEDTDMYPIREIGLKQGEPIMAMPLGSNCGYWTDNQLGYDDFVEKFDAVSITSSDFENLWTEFTSKHPDI